MTKSKYDGLYIWLKRSAVSGVRVTFTQVEFVLGFALPATARSKRQWWANESKPTHHVQSRSWKRAGFRTAKVDLASETLDFVRA